MNDTIIDAHHSLFIRQRAEIQLLRLALRESRGEFVGFNEKVNRTKLLERYPEFLYTVLTKKKGVTK